MLKIELNHQKARLTQNMESNDFLKFVLLQNVIGIISLLIFSRIAMLSFRFSEILSQFLSILSKRLNILTAVLPVSPLRIEEGF